MRDFLTVTSGVVDLGAPLVSIKAQTVCVLASRVLGAFDGFVLEVECSLSADSIQEHTELSVLFCPPEYRIVARHLRELRNPVK